MSVGLDKMHTFVQLHLHRPRDILLGKVNAVHDQFHLGSIPEAVVAQTRELCTESIADAHDFTVHGDTLQVQVRLTEHRAWPEGVFRG